MEKVYMRLDSAHGLLDRSIRPMDAIKLIDFLQQDALGSNEPKCEMTLDYRTLIGFGQSFNRPAKSGAAPPTTRSQLYGIETPTSVLSIGGSKRIDEVIQHLPKCFGRQRKD